MTNFPNHHFKFDYLPKIDNQIDSNYSQNTRTNSESIFQQNSTQNSRFFEPNQILSYFHQLLNDVVLKIEHLKIIDNMTLKAINKQIQLAKSDINLPKLFAFNQFKCFPNIQSINDIRIEIIQEGNLNLNIQDLKVETIQSQPRIWPLTLLCVDLVNSLKEVIFLIFNL